MQHKSLFRFRSILGLRALLIPFLIAALPANGSAVAAQSGEATEVELKAAYIYRFANFVEWPSNSFSSASSPIALCVFNEDELAATLEQAVRGRVAQNRTFKVQRTKKAEALKTCHIIFIGNVRNERLFMILNSLRDSGALLVGESSTFGRDGGHIQFYLDQNKLGFYLNIDAVARAHLKISSKLLLVAAIIHDGAIAQ